MQNSHPTGESIRIIPPELQVISSFCGTFKTGKKKSLPRRTKTAALRIRKPLFMSILRINSFVFMGLQRVIKGTHD
jgi:hypothetical protein